MPLSNKSPCYSHFHRLHSVQQQQQGQQHSISELRRRRPKSPPTCRADNNIIDHNGSARDDDKEKGIFQRINRNFQVERQSRIDDNDRCTLAYGSAKSCCHHSIEHVDDHSKAASTRRVAVTSCEAAKSNYDDCSADNKHSSNDER